MKQAKLTLCAAMLGAIALLSACNTESLKDDARETPIGSVISGDTTTADDYFHRVMERNANTQKETWRPISNDRM